MNFQLSDLDQIFVRITHTNLTDEEAEALLDAAVEKASNEIRVFARQRRATEKNLMAHRAECAERDGVVSAGIVARHAAERVAGLRRNEGLARAESVNGPRRGGSWN